jgi:hypothetical protein
MSYIRPTGPLFAASLLAVIAIACGSSDAGSGFDNNVNTGDGGGASSSSGASGTSSGGSSGTFTGGDGGASSSSGATSDAACASSAVEAQLANLNIIVMYDRSGSMGAPPKFDPAVKWTPVGTAMKSFFGNPASKGVSATLQFFPQDLPGGTVTIAQAQALWCVPGPYSTPRVPLTALPSASFGTAIDATVPQGGTPTRAALDGAIALAKSTAAARPDEKTIVLLVTDGDPDTVVQLQNGQLLELCSQPDALNSVATVSASASAAFAGSPSIPTYVIGIGTSLVNLQSIAAAGGTTNAVLVDVGNPATTTSKLTQALDTIRGQSIPCDIALPAPPNGQTLDINSVNVLITKGGAQTTLTYNKECTGGKGWHYDDANAPTKVVLCTDECTAAKGSSGKVQIAFGCATQGGVAK